jgi:hypothetical protein
MKYAFLAICFFSLGYALPGFPPVVQLVTAVFVGLLLMLALHFYVNNVAYSRIIN